MKLLLIPAILITVFFIMFFANTSKQTPPSQEFNGIRYVALGDSYTIGEGASEAESWPRILTNHLKKDGVNIELIANPSVTGWTTQDVINNELRIYDAANPTFATLLIGVNDWVQGVDAATFEKNLKFILDHMQEKLPDKSNLVVITIPDFSAAPRGQMYSNGRNISAGIAQFNDIIKSNAKERNLTVVDIYPLSQEMQEDSSLISQDGLHPSAKEYAKWEAIIYPEVSKILQR